MSDQRIQAINHALQEMDTRQITGELGWLQYRQQRAQLFYQLQLVPLPEDQDATQHHFPTRQPSITPVADLLPQATSKTTDAPMTNWLMLGAVFAISALVLLIVAWIV